MTQSNFIKEVINALGKRVRASDEDKRSFALDLYTRLPDTIEEAKERERYPEMHEKVANSLRTAQDALTAFQGITYEAHRTLKFIQPSLLDNSFRKDLAKIIVCFEAYNAEWAKAKPSEQKVEYRNLSDYLVARMIAEQYKKCFHTISTGKGNSVASKPKGKFDTGDKSVNTPYDRVCEIVEDYYKISITSYDRRNAVEDIRTIRTTKKIRKIKGGIRGIGIRSIGKL